MGLKAHPMGTRKLRPKEAFRHLRFLIKPTAHITTATLVMALTGFIFWAVAATCYLPSEVGTASAVVSFLHLTFAISTMGLNVSVLRLYSEFGKSAAGTLIALVVSISTALSVAYTLLNPGKALAEHYGVIIAILFTTVFGALYNALATITVPTNKTDVYLKMSVLYSLRVIPLPFLRNLGTRGIICSVGAGFLLGAIYGWWELREKIRVTVSWDFMKRGLGISLANHVGNVVNILPVYLMPTFVMVYAGQEWAGYYYMTFNIGNLMVVPFMAMSTLIMATEKMGEQRIRILKFISFPYWIALVLLTWRFGRTVLNFFGREYSEAFPLLKLISLTVLAVGWVYLELAEMTLREEVHKIFLANLMRGSLFLVLGYTLLKYFGVAGVILAWGIVHLVTLLYLEVQRALKMPKTF